LKKLFVLGLTGLLLLTSCKKDAETGRLKLVLSDAPFPAEWVSEANITVDKIEIRSSGSSDTSKYVVLSEAVQSYNLLDLSNGVTASLIDKDIPVGSYDLIRLRITASTVKMLDGTIYTLTIPSGSASGLKIFINPDIEVQGGLTTELLLDFDVSKSFEVQGKTTSISEIKGFHFKPVLRVANLSTSGRISGTVTGSDEAPYPGVTVSVIAADTVLTSGLTDEQGKYTLLGIPAGTYTLTAAAPNQQQISATGISVTAGNKTEKDLHF
jgi:hypothetical protein